MSDVGCVCTVKMMVSGVGLIGRCFMGSGTSVSKPSFLGLVLLSWWICVCFFNRKMFPQVIVNRTNTMHNCFFSYRICIYVPNSSSGILSSVDIIKCLFKRAFYCFALKIPDCCAFFPLISNFNADF